jgi:heme/copper-type cytochrome/quinol oxidase subunit 2
MSHLVPPLLALLATVNLSAAAPVADSTAAQASAHNAVTWPVLAFIAFDIVLLFVWLFFRDRRTEANEPADQAAP